MLILNKYHSAFEWKGITIHQNGHVLKVGTDAILLGAWIPTILKNPQLILDAGTGTGILALMMSHSFPGSRIEAIDTEEHAVQLASYNFRISTSSARLRAYHMDLFDQDLSGKSDYDLVVCNPPYYFEESHVKADNLGMATNAKQTVYRWLKALAGLMKAGGNLCIVLPFPMTTEWIGIANDLGLYCHHRLNIYSFEKDLQPKRSLLHFGQELIEPAICQLTIYDSIKNHTQEYLELTSHKPGMSRKKPA